MAQTSLLPTSWDVPQKFRDRLGAKVGRQRAMVAEGHLLIVAHAPPHHDDRDRVARLFWRAPDGTWTSKDMGTGINALNKHLDEYDDEIAEMDRLEEVAHSADDYFEVLERLAPVHRAARNLHQVLQDARKACPEFRELINVRDRAYEIERAADLLYSGTKNGLDFAMAQRVEEQAVSSQRMAVASHRLNVLAAFFFPIATLTAVFGTNLQHGWEAKHPPLPFLGVMIIGLIIGPMLTMFITRTHAKGEGG